MDYLRSNNSNKKLSVTRVSSKIKVKPKDIYDDLLMNIFDKLTSDEKAELLDKFLDDNIIAVLSDNHHSLPASNVGSVFHWVLNSIYA